MHSPPAPSTRKRGRQSQSLNSAFNGMDTDIVIPVIGPIGAGKSTFINTAIDNNGQTVRVGHGSNPCTTEPFPVVVDNIPNLKGHRLVLIDTPGFDNPKKRDEEILIQIDTWLKTSYPNKVILGGVLYIHDITNKKFKAADREIIVRFHDRYGDPAIQRTILATTNWGPPEPEGSEDREKELMNIHWVKEIKGGAKVHRFLQNSESVRTIINDLSLQDCLRRFGRPLEASGGLSGGKKKRFQFFQCAIQ